MSAEAAAPPLALTVDETARLLHLGLRQTYEALRRDELPAIRIGRRWFVKRAELYRMFGLDAAGPQSARAAELPLDSGPESPHV